MIIQPVIDIAEICARHGITQAVISPGSRNAPITLAFARHPDIQTFVIPDERSAGFVALGLAQSSHKPVAAITTSGTAAANLYPAIIEAFYSRTPLLVITADRPPEWIGQHDGQTIRQQNIYENHIKKSFQFPVAFGHPEAVWHAHRMVNEAINIANDAKGPAHINVPLREPFYPKAGERFDYSKNIKIIKSVQAPPRLPDEQKKTLREEAGSYEKIMILAGQSERDDSLTQLLGVLTENRRWVVCGDIIANNLPGNAFTLHDIFLKKSSKIHDLRPDLLITFGRSVLSKAMKMFLRNLPPEAHWHVGVDDDVADTFKSLTKTIPVDPHEFFGIFAEELSSDPLQEQYYDWWKEHEETAGNLINDFLKKEKLSDFHAVNVIMKNLPSDSHLHLANSMPVRYANYFRPKHEKNIKVWGNRGTSGIDGCTSTVVGHAINIGQINTIITGDMAFFYDRNALWHSHVPDNLRIVILNNHGGGIFRLINGPKGLDELETFFETEQSLTTANTAKDFNMKYFAPKSSDELHAMLPGFFDTMTGPAILEIETDPHVNQKVFEDFNPNNSGDNYGNA